MHNLMSVFLLFITYSFIGWLIELFVFIFSDKRVVNRGFLIGPYCPIYGFGSIFIIFCLSHAIAHPIMVLASAAIICATIEYITSYIMEKLFHARWWDYSKDPFNLNGRITLLNTFLFGVLGMTLIYIVNPFLIELFNDFNKVTLIIVSMSIFLIFITDIIISFSITSKIKSAAREIRIDSTEEITRKVIEIIKEKRLPKRLMKAFPNIHFK